MVRIELRRLNEGADVTSICRNYSHLLSHWVSADDKQKSVVVDDSYPVVGAQNAAPKMSGENKEKEKEKEKEEEEEEEVLMPTIPLDTFTAFGGVFLYYCIRSTSGSGEDQEILYASAVGDIPATMYKAIQTNTRPRKSYPDSVEIVRSDFESKFDIRISYDSDKHVPVPVPCGALIDFKRMQVKPTVKYYNDVTSTSTPTPTLTSTELQSRAGAGAGEETRYVCLVLPYPTVPYRTLPYPT